MTGKHGTKNQTMKKTGQHREKNEIKKKINTSLENEVDPRVLRTCVIVTNLSQYVDLQVVERYFTKFGKIVDRCLVSRGLKFMRAAIIKMRSEKQVNKVSPNAPLHAARDEFVGPKRIFDLNFIQTIN